MGLASQRTAITQYFYSNWNEANGKVAYPNKAFATPDGEVFLVFNLLSYYRHRASIGRNQWLTRRFGAVQIDIYIPEGQGTHNARALADDLEALFESLSLTTSDNQLIQFGTPNTSAVATNEQRASNLEDSYHRLVMTCEFYTNEVKSQ